MEKIIIEHDVFDISNRLKEIDSSYFIVYNTITKTYEVYSKEGEKSTFCFGGFSNLDERTVVKALKTRTEKIDEIIKEIEEENDKLEKNLKKDLFFKIKDELKEVKIESY